MQKRSNRVSAFLATVAIAPLGLNLYGCGPEAPPPKPVEAKVYSSIQQCKDAETNDAVCDTSFAEAQKAHAATAPNFTQKQLCEQEYGVGNCETQRRTNSDGSFSDVFIPAFAGFMLGNALGNMGGGYDYDRRDRDRRSYGPAAYPIYYGSNGAVYSGRQQIAQSSPRYVNTNARSSTGSTVRGYSAPRTISVTPAAGGRSFASVGSTSRGGFGATSSARGFAGG